MATEYVKKLENLATEKRTLKDNVRKHKLDRLGLMENVGLSTQPIVTEQQKTNEAIATLNESLQVTPKKQLEFQKTFEIDFRNIDQNLPKSIRPVFSQDGFKIGKAYIQVDREHRLLRVHGKQNTFQITQELVDLIKGLPLENYSETVMHDYKNLLIDINASTRSKRVRQLNGLVTKTGEGMTFLPDNVVELKSRLEKVLSAAREGHTNVFNEGMAILKRLLEKSAITSYEFEKLSKSFS